MQQTDRLGVSILQYFFSDIGWLFREQTVQDFGIDAHVEIMSRSGPTGKLIALQIKSGASYFNEQTRDSFIHRTDERHVSYWLGHSMPVVLVLFDPRSKISYWQVVNDKTAKRAGKNWKVAVPKENTFENYEKVKRSLAGISQPEPYLRRLNRLRVDRKWIDLIREGGEVWISFDSWVNKSLPRYQITISCDSFEEKWPVTYMPGGDVETMLEHYFPWATFETDPSELRESARDQWAAECYSGKDPDTREPYFLTSFDEWYVAPAGIVPIYEDGEIASYHLKLSLNSFAQAFIALDSFLADPNALEESAFTLEGLG